MKRRHLLRHLKAHGCMFRREGSNHSIYRNPAKGGTVPVPRHTEVANNLAHKICKTSAYTHLADGDDTTEKAPLSLTGSHVILMGCDTVAANILQHGTKSFWFLEARPAGFEPATRGLEERGGVFADVSCG